MFYSPQIDVYFTLQLLPKILQTQALFLPQHLIPLLEQDMPKGMQMDILGPPPRLQEIQTSLEVVNINPFLLILVLKFHRSIEGLRVDRLQVRVLQVP